MNKVRKLLWKSQRGNYDLKKQNEYTNLGIRDKVKLKLMQMDREEEKQKYREAELKRI